MLKRMQMQSSHTCTVGLCFLACTTSLFWSIVQEVYDGICACSELCDCCFKKAEQARDSHFSAFIIIVINNSY